MNPSARYTRRELFLSLAGMAGAALLAGCARREPLLRVGSNVWPGYELLYVAQQQGVLDPAQVRLVRMGSATLVLQALAAGQLEAACLTLDEVLSAIADGIPLRVIAVFDFSQGADAVLARPGLRTAAELKGKRVCVEKSAVGAVMLDAFLKHRHLELADLELHYATVDEHAEEYRSGHSDIVVTFSPIIEQLEKLGAQRIFDSRQIPGRIVDVLVTTEASLQRAPQALGQVVAAQFSMLAQMKADLTSLAPHLAAGLGIPVDEVPGAYAGMELLDLAANRQWLTGEPAPLEKIAAELQEIMLGARLLSAKVPVAQLVDPSLLPRGG